MEKTRNYYYENFKNIVILISVASHPLISGYIFALKLNLELKLK